MAVSRLGLAFVSASLGKVLGFIRIQAIAVSLGASLVTDAVFLSLTVLTLFDIVFVSGSAVLVVQVVYLRKLLLSSRLALARYLRSALLWSMTAVVIGLLTALFAESLAAWIAPGFDAPTRAVFQRMCWVGALIPLATTIMVYVSSFNRLHGREVLYTVNPIVVNGASVVVLFASRALGWSAVATADALLTCVFASTVLMVCVQLAFVDTSDRALAGRLLLFALRPLRFKAAIKAHPRELAAVWPVAGALLLQQGFTMISYAFASNVGDGSLTLVGLAERLTNVVLALVVMTFVTVLEPRWARTLATRRGSVDQIKGDLLVITLLVLAISSSIVFAGDSAARVLFAYGALSTEAAEQLGTVAKLFGFCLPGTALALVFARLLVIVGRTRILMVTNGVLLILHGSACWILVNAFGLAGIPLSVALACSVQTLLYGFLLYRNLGSDVRPKSVAKVALAGVIGFVSTYGISLVDLPDLSRILLVGIVSLLSTTIAARTLGLSFERAIARLAEL